MRAPYDTPAAVSKQNADIARPAAQKKSTGRRPRAEVLSALLLILRANNATMNVMGLHHVHLVTSSVNVANASWRAETPPTFTVSGHAEYKQAVTQFHRYRPCGIQTGRR